MDHSRVRQNSFDLATTLGKASKRSYYSGRPTEVQLATWEWIYAQADLVGPMLGIPVHELRSWASDELQDLMVRT
jgi:hypothetical protein